jgi:hypothetical protein
VLVSNFEKSLVDCLKRPTHCPPFHELVRLCRKCEKLPDLEKILKYATDCNVQALFNRLGFLFEKNLSYWEIQEDFFKFIEDRMSRKQTEWPIPYEHQRIIGESLKNQSRGMGRLQTCSQNAQSFESKNRWKVQFLQQN